MKKAIFLFLLATVSLCIYSQEPIKGVSFETENPVAPTDSSLVSGKLQQLTTSNPELMHFNNPHARSQFDTSIPVGFTDTYTNYLNNYFFYSVTGKSDIWEGISTINSAYFTLNYATDIVNVKAGSSLWKYDFHGRVYGDAAFFVDASVNPFPWLTLGVYGQYSLRSERNFEKYRAFMPEPMLPSTKFGGYSTIMFNQTFGIQGGIGRQFNPLKGSWETTYTIGPAIELRKKKRK